MLSSITNDPAGHPSIDAVVWDYDGTLAETRFADEEAVRKVVAQHPSAIAGATVFWATEGQPIGTRVELAWPGRGPELLPIFEEFCAPRPFPGVAGAVRALSHRGFGLAVVSSRRRDAVEWGLVTMGLREFFACVVGLGDVAEPKPSPEGLLLALATIGAEPARAVYVGDSELDMEAAQRAGMAAWRATWALPQLGGLAIEAVKTPREVLRRVDDEPVIGAESA